MYVGISKVSDTLFFIAINKGIALLQIVGFSCNRSIMFQVLCLFFIDFSLLTLINSSPEFLCVLTATHWWITDPFLLESLAGPSCLPLGTLRSTLKPFWKGEGAGSALLPGLFKVMLDWQSMLLISVGFRMTCRSI